MDDKNEESGEYLVFDGNIPEDNYEVTSVVQNMDGTAITLKGQNHTLTVAFGSVQALSVCDEGVRIESYNRIADIRTYRKNGFFGNPIFKVSNSPFMRWLAYESCGFSASQNHYVIITLNDFIDIAAPFDPKITVEERVNTLLIRKYLRYF